MPLLAFLTLYKFPFVFLATKAASAIFGTHAFIVFIHGVLTLGTDAVNTNPKAFGLF